MTVELFVRESGSGLPLVLLHAFPLSSAMWLAQREALADTARVITPDLRGFGGSPLGDTDDTGRHPRSPHPGSPGADAPSLDAMADDVAALLDRLGLDHVVLGGLSMGGYVTMAFLRRHPHRVRALVLADTKASPDSDAARANRERIAAEVESDADSTVVVDDVLPTLLGSTTATERLMVAGRVKALVQAAPAPAVAWAQRAMAARPDSLADLTAADVPALVVVGEEDQLSPVADAEAMTAALPQGRLVVLPAAGHLSAVETPDAFAAAVRDFMVGLA